MPASVLGHLPVRASSSYSKVVSSCIVRVQGTLRTFQNMGTASVKVLAALPTNTCNHRNQQEASVCTVERLKRAITDATRFSHSTYHWRWDWQQCNLRCKTFQDQSRWEVIEAHNVPCCLCTRSLITTFCAGVCNIPFSIYY